MAELNFDDTESFVDLADVFEELDTIVVDINDMIIEEF